MQSPCVLTSNRVEEHTYHSSATQPQTLQRGSMKKVETQQSNQFHLYTNAHNMGNKKEELEDTMELEIFDLITLD